MGINCLFGAISLLILAKLGGLAFDKIDKSVPFLFASFSSTILFLVILFTRSKIDVSPKHFMEAHHHPHQINASDKTTTLQTTLDTNHNNVDEKI
jgi:hypothetical protein